MAYKSYAVTVDGAMDKGLERFRAMRLGYLGACILIFLLSTLSKALGEALKPVPVVGLLYQVLGFFLGLLFLRAYFLCAMRCASGQRPLAPGLWSLDRRFGEFLLTLLVMAVAFFLVSLPLVFALWASGSIRGGFLAVTPVLIVGAFNLPFMVWLFLRTHNALFLSAVGISGGIERSWAATEGRVMDNFSLMVRAALPAIFILIPMGVLYGLFYRPYHPLILLLLLPFGLGLGYYWARAQVIRATWAMLLTGTALDGKKSTAKRRLAPKPRAKR